MHSTYHSQRRVDLHCLRSTPAEWGPSWSSGCESPLEMQRNCRWDIFREGTIYKESLIPHNGFQHLPQSEEANSPLSQCLSSETFPDAFSPHHDLNPGKSQAALGCERVHRKASVPSFPLRPPTWSRPAGGGRGKLWLSRNWHEVYKHMTFVTFTKTCKMWQLFTIQRGWGCFVFQ